MLTLNNLAIVGITIEDLKESTCGKVESDFHVRLSHLPCTLDDGKSNFVYARYWWDLGAKNDSPDDSMDDISIPSFFVSIWGRKQKGYTVIVVSHEGVLVYLGKHTLSACFLIRLALWFVIFFHVNQKQNGLNLVLCWLAQANILFYSWTKTKRKSTLTNLLFLFVAYTMYQLLCNTTLVSDPTMAWREDRSR